MAERLRDITDPSQIADISGYSPDLTLAQKVEVLETLDLEKRLRLVLGWARDTLADLTLRERVKSNVEEGIERTQREFLLAPPARGHPQGVERARRHRRRLARRLPDADRGARRPGGGEDGGAARDRQARADERAEPGARLDPDLARHGLRDPLGSPDRGPSRRQRGRHGSSTRTTTV